MILFAPIAWPVAKLLDRVLGQDEGHTSVLPCVSGSGLTGFIWPHDGLWDADRVLYSYKKAELKSFLQFHREGNEPLRDDEVGSIH